MKKLDQNTENNIKSKNFTERDFVGLFLRLLCKNGVYKIDEEELNRKLFYYYNDPKFNELFQDVCKKRGTLYPEVDIYAGMYFEKCFGNITWNITKPNLLFLHYKKDADLSLYEDKLSDQGKLLMYKMAEEISTKDKIESQSKHKINIYNCNPNEFYILTHGQYKNNVIGWNLLTDGDINAINCLDTKELNYCFFDSPLYPNQKIQCNQNSIVSVNLKNASYAVMQGLCDSKIQHLRVFTCLTSLEQLSQVSSIANTEYKTSDNLLIKDEPYIRKLILK